MPERLTAAAGAFSPTDVGLVFREVSGQAFRVVSYDSLTTVTVEPISALRYRLHCARYGARYVARRVWSAPFLTFCAAEDWARAHLSRGKPDA
jgi:hypothetical protein